MNHSPSPVASKGFFWFLPGKFCHCGSVIAVLHYLPLFTAIDVFIAELSKYGAPPAISNCFVHFPTAEMFIWYLKRLADLEGRRYGDCPSWPTPSGLFSSQPNMRGPNFCSQCFPISFLAFNVISPLFSKAVRNIK